MFKSGGLSLSGPCGRGRRDAPDAFYKYKYNTNLYSAISRERIGGAYQQNSLGLAELRSFYINKMH